MFFHSILSELPCMKQAAINTATTKDMTWTCSLTPFAFDILQGRRRERLSKKNPIALTPLANVAFSIRFDLA